MGKFSLEINKTIKKKDVRSKPSLQEYYNSPNRHDNPINPAILRSKSLSNNSEINFGQVTISAIVSPKNGQKIYEHKQSDEKAANTDIEENTYISTHVINQVINLVDNLHLDTPSYLELPESNAD